MFLNKAIIIGILTRDPEIKALTTGIKVCTFSLATNRVWKDKEGKKQEGVDYHNIVVFGRTAELVAQYLKKGSGALVEGRLQTRSWEDKGSGEKKYRTEIVAASRQKYCAPRKSVEELLKKWDEAGSAPPKEDEVSDIEEKFEEPLI